MSKIRQTKITKFARGKPCTLRVSGYGGCSDPDTVVFCHAPSSGKGMSKKSPDWWGAFGCQSCHNNVDGRARRLSPEEKDEAWLRGIYETQESLIDAGLIEVKT